MFSKRSCSFVAAVLVPFGLLGVSATKADEDPHCYTLASLHGTYALVASYGDHIAQSLAVRYFDGQGNLKGPFLVNQPVVGSPTGERELVSGTQVGTYSINCDGTGVFTRYLKTSTGLTVTQTDDFLVTQAVIRDDGRLLATGLTDMTRTASGIVPGGVFVTRTYTRRPDSSQ